VQAEHDMKPYLMFAAMIGLSFLAMYGLMYAMVDRFENVFGNLNQVYMAGLMTAPMAILELLLMRKMYPNPMLNMALLATSLVFLGLFWFGIRLQAGIGDRQFLRSMIPHHAGAILMCGEAPVSDPEIKALCRTIIDSQQKEIDQMKRILDRS